MASGDHEGLLCREAASSGSLVVLRSLVRNAPGFTHTESDGAFAWINRYGTETSDPFGLVWSFAHPLKK